MLSWLREATGGLPRVFWFLWTGTLINRLGAFVIIFLALYLTTDRDFSASQAGLVIGLYGAGAAVGTVTGGVLADRWGRRPTLITAQFGGAALMLLLGFADDYWQLLVVALLLGTFAEAARPAFSAMMVDVVPERDRVRAYSLNYWAINLGFAVASVGAGLAAKADYLLLFVIDAGTTAACGLITVLFLRETRPTGPAVAGAGGGAGPGLGTVFRDRVFVGFLLLNFGSIVVMFQHQSTLPIAMSNDGLSPATFGAVIAVNGVLIVLGQLFVPKLVAGRDRSRVLAVAALLIGVGFGLGSLADSAWFYVVTVLVWTLGEMLQSPSISSLVAELSPRSLRGRYQGVSSLSYSVGVATAPIAGGFVQEHLGDAVLWLGCLAVCALAAAGQIVSGPTRERRAASLRETEVQLTSTAVRPQDRGTPPPAVADPPPPPELTPTRD